MYKIIDRGSTTENIQQISKFLNIEEDKIVIGKDKNNNFVSVFIKDYSNNQPFIHANLNQILSLDITGDNRETVVTVLDDMDNEEFNKKYPYKRLPINFNYYTIDLQNYKILTQIDTRQYYDNDNWDNRNYFYTSEEANRVLNQIIELLNHNFNLA